MFQIGDVMVGLNGPLFSLGHKFHFIRHLISCP
jgi:hypothetical protein